MKLQPLSGYVLIEPIEEDTETQGGFVVPETAKDRPSKGIVLAVGEGITHEHGAHNTPVVENQKVVFRRFAGQAIREEGKDLRLVKFEDVIGVYG